MKNPYIRAAVQTLAFVAYIVIITLGYTFLGEAVGSETAQAIFYSGLGLVAIVIIYMLNLSRARFYSKD